MIPVALHEGPESRTAVEDAVSEIPQLKGTFREVENCVLYIDSTVQVRRQRNDQGSRMDPST